MHVFQRRADHIDHAVRITTCWKSAPDLVALPEPHPHTDGASESNSHTVSEGAKKRGKQPSKAHCRHATGRQAGRHAQVKRASCREEVSRVRARGTKAGKQAGRASVRGKDARASENGEGRRFRFCFHSTQKGKCSGPASPQELNSATAYHQFPVDFHRPSRWPRRRRRHGLALVGCTFRRQPANLPHLLPGPPQEGRRRYSSR